MSHGIYINSLLWKEKATDFQILSNALNEISLSNLFIALLKKMSSITYDIIIFSSLQL